MPIPDSNNIYKEMFKQYLDNNVQVIGDYGTGKEKVIELIVAIIIIIIIMEFKSKYGMLVLNGDSIQQNAYARKLEDGHIPKLDDLSQWEYNIDTDYSHLLALLDQNIILGNKLTIYATQIEECEPELTILEQANIEKQEKLSLMTNGQLFKKTIDRLDNLSAEESIESEQS